MLKNTRYQEEELGDTQLLLLYRSTKGYYSSRQYSTYDSRHRICHMQFQTFLV